MFEISDSIVRQIIFAMENQNLRYVMDVDRGALVRRETIPESKRPRDDTVLDPEATYQPLPSWKSADGFQLMERFVAQLHNPIVDSELQAILVSGKRVFRRFKDALKEHPEVERRYYAFKFLEMRERIHEWYNMIRDICGLEIVELGADEEIDDVVRSDVAIEEMKKVPATLISEFDRQSFFEVHAGLPNTVIRHLYRRRRGRMPEPGDGRATVIAAHTPMDDLCGYVWYSRELLENGTTLLTLDSLHVLHEYRGIGIGTALLETVLDRMLRECESGMVVMSRLPGFDQTIARVLSRYGLEPRSQEWVGPINPAE